MLALGPAVAAPCENPAKGKALNPGSKSFPWLACEGRQAKDMRTGQNYFILFTSRILHPCHFFQIFSLANGKTLGASGS